MRCLLVCLAIAGCARAGQENSIIGGLIDAGPRGDAVLEPDASPIDAPPAQVTLSQTTSGQLSPGLSFNCHRITTGATRENSYYRVFALSDHGVAGMLHVTQVGFGIDTAAAGAGGMQPATVRLATYGGTPGGPTLDSSLIRALASVDIQIPDGNGTRMTVPIEADVAPAANLLVELFIPDGLAAGHHFLIGANDLGERQPGYTRGPDCGVTAPTSMASIATENMLDEADIVLTVTGVTSTPD